MSRYRVAAWLRTFAWRDSTGSDGLARFSLRKETRPESRFSRPTGVSAVMRLIFSLEMSSLFVQEMGKSKYRERRWR